MFRHYTTVVFSAAAFLVFSLLFTAVGLAQERDPISMEVGETRTFYGARVCSGFESSYSVDDNLPAFIDLETISVIQSTSSTTGVTTARIRFSLSVALDAPTGTYPVDITYTLNRPGGECTRDFAYDLTITPAQPPVAEFVAERTLVAERANVGFTDLSEHAIGSWSWNFGDGGSSNERNPEYSYASEGVYTVTLAVTGPAGNDTEVKSDYITVRPEGSPGVLRWSFGVDGRVGGNPAVADDGTIYVFGSGNEEGIHAVSPDGVRLWWLRTDRGQPYSHIIGDDGTIFISTEYGLEAVSAEGDRIWSVSLPEEGGPLALGYGDVLYVESGVELLAFSQDGNRLWVFSPGGSDYFVSYPGVGIDGNVHVVTDDGNLFEIDTSGNVVSTYPSYFVNPYGSGVSLGRDRSRYYGTHDGFLAIGPDNTEIWQHSAGASAYYSPVIGLYDEIFFIEEHDYSPRCALVTHCFFLRKLDTAGNLVWSFEQPLTEYIGGGVSPSLGADGTLYFGFNSTFYAINPDGSEKWRFDAGDYIFGSPAIGGDGSVYFTADGRLFAVGASNVAYANSPWPRGEGRDNRNTARAVNQHPRGLIDTPSSDITIGVGQSLSFSATILDEYPEDAEILWDFDGQATNSTVEDPGEITFSSIGTYTVSLQVTDSIGLSDPDPPGVVVTVTAELPALIHSDGFE